jgi:hypothetical protein
MNREDKRKTTKILKGKGYSEKDIIAAIAYKESIKNSIIIPEGQQVKLNVKSIK